MGLNFFIFAFLSLLPTPSIAGDLLTGGDFEAPFKFLLHADMIPISHNSWTYYSSPDWRDTSSSSINPYLNNGVGWNRFPAKNGKTNQSYIGLAFKRSHMEGIVRELLEPLTEGINYKTGFTVAYTGIWQTDSSNVFNQRAYSLYGMLFKYDDYDLANAMDSNRYAKSHIVIETPTEWDTDTHQKCYPGDQSNYKWIHFEKEFSARGQERFYALSGAPSDDGFSYYLFDDIYLQCSPDAAFSFLHEKLIEKNKINWQVLDDQKNSIVRSPNIWNSVSSLWEVLEVDEFGNSLGNPSKKITKKDQPELGIFDQTDLKQLFSRSPFDHSAHYYKITHQNRCQNNPADYESEATAWLMDPAPPIELNAQITSAPQSCTESKSEIVSQFTLTQSDNIQLLSGEAKIYSIENNAETFLEKKWMPLGIDRTFNSDSVVFDRNHRPGNYKIVFAVSYIYQGNQHSISFSQNHVISLPDPLTLNGPLQTITSEANLYTLQDPQTYSFQTINWQHQDDSYQWQKDASTSSQNTIVWNYPGKYLVKARAEWFTPQCFAEIEKSIEVSQRPPLKLSTTLHSPKSCLEDQDKITSEYTISDDPLNPNSAFQLTTLTAHLFRDGVLDETKTLTNPVTTGQIQFKNKHIPAEYRIDYELNYQILGIAQNPILKSESFLVSSPVQPVIHGSSTTNFTKLETYSIDDPTPLTYKTINWSHQNDSLAWDNDINSTGLSNQVSWSTAGTRSVKVKVGAFHPSCSAETIKEVKVEKVIPVVSITAPPQLSCASKEKFQAKIKVENFQIPITKIYGSLYFKNKKIEDYSILNPTELNPTVLLNNNQNPGHYKITLKVDYEINPGITLTTDPIKTEFDVTPPTVTISGPTLLGVNQEGTFHFQSDEIEMPDSVSWSYPGKKSATGSQLMSWAQRGQYDVNAKFNWGGGCVIDTQNTLVVKVREEGRPYIPNAFTLNDDGINESFIIKGFDTYIMSFEVFGRWGEIIYKMKFKNEASHDVENFEAWNGVLDNGNSIRAGVYTFKVQYHSYLNSQVRIAGGTLTVAR